MRSAVTLVLALSAVSLAVPAVAGGAATTDVRTRIPVVPGPGVTLTSSGTASALAARETTGPDTFAIYGGPDRPTEGKFQLSDGVTPDWGGGNGLPGGYGGDPGAWTPHDLTDQPVYFHQDTFNAANLNGHGPGNHAMWSGVAAGDPQAATWVHGQGYGNNWDDVLMYESAPLADPSVGQVVDLDFYFNYDLEPGWDFFTVEFDSAWDGWTAIGSVTASNADSLGVFQAPGVRFSDVATRQIVFAGNDYGGDNSDQIRIRLRVRTDGAWSDEDGLWPTLAGAVQLDDITLTTSQGSFSEDFEGVGPYLFNPDKAPFAGDFADGYPRLTDLDLCRENQTPVIGFIDYGQVIRNGPGLTGETSTGGSTSLGISYGIPGNFVTNYNGGLSFGATSVTNEVWSPEISWDLPGTVDDAHDVAGAFIRFDNWMHLPLINGNFMLWHVRSAPVGGNFGAWTDRNFVYYGATPVWITQVLDVSNLLVQQPERVQMALALWDYASVFGFPGTAATPSPCFDNAAFYKYRLAGPAIATREIDLAQDGFPISGSIDVSTQAARDALDIPFSMCRDINTGDFNNVPGDSIVFGVESQIAGAEFAEARMFWALKTNPLFEDAVRQAPSRPRDENVVAGPAGTIWTGEAVADSSLSNLYYALSGGFEVSLPDVDFMYPGDVLHYYIQATDTDGRVSTLPNDITGFGDFGPMSPFDRAFIVRGLPSIQDASGTQPRILVINDFGHRGGEDEFTTSLRESGYEEGVDYDTYTVMGPSSGVSNGIGSAGAHGATVNQLAGYEHMIYFLGNLTTQSLSNGDATLSGNDKSNDIDVLEQWHALPGPRNMAYFGDNIVSAIADDSPEGLYYVTNTMGVDVLSHDVRPAIGGQTAPLVVPNDLGSHASSFSTEYVAYGGCLTLNTFDWIQPLGGGEAGHWFTDLQGLPITDPAAGVASVIRPTANGVEITFPYSVMFIQGVARPAGPSARTLLFQEVLGLFNAPGGGSPAVAAPAARVAELRVAPNPFNPSTTVEFTAAIGTKGSVRVYNLRGQVVRLLHNGEFSTTRFVWDGTDESGATVASGIYIVRAEAEGVTRTTKVALVK